MIGSLRDQTGSAIMTVPDYQRVVDHIVARVESGELRPGDKLESIVRLAKMLETSQTTVKSAQAILRAQGWITGHQGKAVYVAANPPTDRQQPARPAG